MSLYAVQKVIYEVNRNPEAMAALRADSEKFLTAYSLNDEERGALLARLVVRTGCQRSVIDAFRGLLRSGVECLSGSDARRGCRAWPGTRRDLRDQRKRK